MSGGGYGLIVILLCFGLAGGIVGRVKGGSFTMWFLIAFCVPFIGLVTAILYRYENHELRRECPRCHKVVKLHDAVCMRCGTELEFPEVAIAPEAPALGSTRRLTPARSDRTGGRPRAGVALPACLGRRSRAAAGRRVCDDH